MFCIIVGLTNRPRDTLRMQIPTVKFVERVCLIPLVSFIIPLAYNLVLILASAVFGFLTRKLPENFNESWYIFVSVATTTFLWTVFLPTYFTTFYASHQTAVLASCLILNAVVSLFCLYLPKLYAVYFLDENQYVVNNTMTKASARVQPVGHEGRGVNVTDNSIVET